MLKGSEIAVHGTGLSKVRIAHISDFHNSRLKEDVLHTVREGAPDVVAITGDLIDRRRHGTDRAISLVRGLAEIAPVVYVTGNHEGGSYEFPLLERELRAAGAAVLRNGCAVVHTAAGDIPFLGLDDPRFSGGESGEENIALVQKTLETLGVGGRIVLCHRPELLPAYRAAGAKLVLCGHAHGGQWRLPMAIYAPGQGLFPKYTSGLYADGGTQMVVSRGVGNSRCPLRIHNPPEVVFVTVFD